jgi:hypothetical protein
MEIDSDLAALLGRALTLDPSSMPPELRMTIESELEARGISYSISQHYHHSTHAPAPPQQHPQAVPRTVAPPSSSRPTCEALLRQNGIDPASLLPPQLQLFRIADTPQQDRLLELWRICPPAMQARQDPSLAWTPTSVALEEDRTRDRLLQEHCRQVVGEIESRHQPQQQQEEEVIMSLDGTPVQAADGSWAPAPSSYAHNAAYRDESEPYMAEGYLELMQEYGYDPQAHVGGTHPGGPYFAATAAAPSTATPSSSASYSPATDPVYRAAGCGRFGPAGLHMEQMDVAM